MAVENTIDHAIAFLYKGKDYLKVMDFSLSVPFLAPRVKAKISGFATDILRMVVSVMRRTLSWCSLSTNATELLRCSIATVGTGWVSRPVTRYNILKRRKLDGKSRVKLV
jgi:hypothetical protein